MNSFFKTNFFTKNALITFCFFTSLLSAIAQPTITVSPANLTAFSGCSGSTTTAQSFTVSGVNLTANIIITTPSGFEISSTSSTAGFNSTSLTLVQSSGTVNSTTIYVRTTTVATGTPSGNITLTSTGATQKDKAVSATINAIPTISGTLTIFSGNSQLTGSGTAHGSTPWTSSNTAVATVNSTGLVTAVTGGTSTITYMENTGCSKTATFTVTMPTITVSPASLTAFLGCTGVNTASQSFTVSAVNLTSDIIITTPSGFEISSTSSTVGFSSTSLTLVQTSGTVNSTTIYVRTTTVATGTPSGNITLTSTGVTQIDKAVSATINVTPSISGELTKKRTETSQLTGSGIAFATTPWTSSNAAIASVNSTGLVTAVSAGTCTITYKSNSGCTTTVTFTTTPITIYANSITGLDTNNGLTQAAAKKTVTAAYTTAAAGDIIDLTGTFNWSDAAETTTTNGFTISKNIIIRGQGADQTIVQANALPNVASKNVFYISSGTVSLEKLTIRNGNSSKGSGVYNLGSLKISYCNISYNKATSSAGGLYHGANNTLTIEGCTFNNNEAPSGGALSNDFANANGNMIITNCTFAYNKQTSTVATVGGAAIWVLNGSNNNVTNFTFAYNDLAVGTGNGAALFIRQGYVKLKNCILAKNTI